MAITKIHVIKSTLGKALAYIENPDKTDGQRLVSGYNCEPQTASIDFEMTAGLAHKARNLKRKRSTNLAYHLIQSFSPEDAVTPEQAHELGKKLAFEYTGGKYEYVVATHIDKGHIHNHIMINAVSFYDYKKLRTVPYRTARQIRDISDRLCMEAHLSVIDDPQKIGQLYPENAGKKKSVSNRTEIRKRLNFCLERATDYSQFLSMAKELEITPTIRGKHMSYLLEGAGRAVRDNSLSDTDTFTYAGICARLSDNAQEQKYLRKTITGILRSATGMADFADKLKTAGIETKVKKSTEQVLYRSTALDGAWVPEDALGSEFTSEGIEYALKNGKMQLSDGAENSLLDRYQKLTIQYPEVCTAAVKLSSRQILSAGKNGLVLQAHDDKRTTYAAAAKHLQICRTYKPIWMEYAAKPLNQKMEYFNQHSTELQAYRNAAAYLEKEGIDQSVEIDKVNVLAQEMGHRMDELVEQLRDVNLQEQKVRQERQTFAEIRSDLVE